MVLLKIEQKALHKSTHILVGRIVFEGVARILLRRGYHFQCL